MDNTQSDAQDMTDAQCPELQLLVLPESMPFFTTLFQSGVEIETNAQTPLGEFLGNCPGFTHQYLANTVQTIFLNGTAVDNLQIPLTGEHPVVALSAAMPGLAGAIFRKSGAHATLRTVHTDHEEKTIKKGPLTVTLKLFNQIAREKGILLLNLGVIISANVLTRFLDKRPEFMNMVKGATFDGQNITSNEITEKIHGVTLIRLRVSDINPV